MAEIAINKTIAIILMVVVLIGALSLIFIGGETIAKYIKNIIPELTPVHEDTDEEIIVDETIAPEDIVGKIQSFDPSGFFNKQDYLWCKDNSEQYIRLEFYIKDNSIYLIGKVAQLYKVGELKNNCLNFFSTYEENGIQVPLLEVYFQTPRCYYELKNSCVKQGIYLTKPKNS
jgi:hypothetical protein